MQNPETAPEVAQIAEELATLETRREEIARQCQSAQTTLKKAKNAAIDGAALETVVEAQTRANALSSTLEMMEARLKDKRAQLASTQAQAKRAQQESQLLAAALDFDEQRAALETEARDFASQFESGLSQLIAKARAAMRAQIAVERAAYAMEDESQQAPSTLERDGQSVGITAMRHQGPTTFSILAASFGDGLTRRLIADGIATRLSMENSAKLSLEQSEREERGHNAVSRELEADEIASPTAYADPLKVEVRSLSR